MRFYKSLSDKQIELFVFLFFSLVFVYFTSYQLFQPAFWDEVKVYFKPLWEFYNSPSAFIFDRAAHQFERPLGQNLIYYPTLLIFGKNIIAVRIQNLFMFIISHYFLYKSFTQNKSQSDKVCVLLLLFYLCTIPAYIIYTTQFVGAPQLFFLMSVCLFCIQFFPQRVLLIFFISLLMGSFRESSLAFALAIFAFWGVPGKRKPILISSLAIIIGFLLNLILTKIRTGDFFQHMALTENHLFQLSLFEALTKFHSHFLLSYKLLIPFSISVLLILRYFSFQSLKENKYFTFSFLIASLFILIFSFHKFAIVRYFWIATPFFLYLCFYSVIKLSQSNRVRIVLILVCFLSSFIIGDPHSETKESIFYRYIGPEYTLRNTEHRRAHQEILKKIKNNAPAGSEIITSWPFEAMLSTSHLGYGPYIPYKLNDIYDGEPFDFQKPDVILWNNYPEQ
ncbi:MAG: hypothetical protein CME62_03995 [Halobacteriovoraceae bacterium]|nr:hypothetical protein [Halobacteriovoraceae bacterium]